MFIPGRERPFWPIAILVFALLPAANYFPVLTGSVPFPAHIVQPFRAWGGSGAWPPHPEIGDLMTSFYPFHALAARAAQEEGTLPLWNPYVLSGAPFLANSQSALFYPFNARYYFLPVHIAWVSVLLIRMFLAASFMALFVRSIGVSQTGALFSGIVFSFCGFITAWQGQALGDASIWLPIICYSVVRLSRDPSPFSIALAGFVFAMPVLAGHPETAAHSTLVGSALALTLWALPTKDAPPFKFKFPVSFAAAGFLALGLASVQMIPTLEWLGQMGDQFKGAWPALPLHQAQGIFSRDVSSSPNSGGIFVPEGMAYLGMLTLLAASLGLLHKARRYVAFLALLTVVAIAIAYSVEPLRWVVTQIPMFRSLKNGRFIFVASFGVAALAGLGISMLEELPVANDRTRRYAWLLLSGTLAVVLFSISRLQLATASDPAFAGSPSFSAVLACLGVIPIAWKLAARSRARMFPLVICGLAALELATFSYGFVGFFEPGEIFPAAPLFEFLNKNADPRQFRVAQVGTPYSANAGMMYRFASADGYDIALERTKLFTADFSQEREDGIFLVADKIVQVEDRRLDMLNIKYFVVDRAAPEFQQLSARPNRFRSAFDDGHVVAFENLRVLPRAFLVPASGIELLPAKDSQFERLKDPAFDPLRNGILSSGNRFRNAESPLAGPRQMPVVIEPSGINEQAFRIEASTDALLVISQIFYPGWTATVDGQEVPVEDVNYALSGILVPAGGHDVRLKFEPRSFRAGLAVTILSLAALAALILTGIYRRPMAPRRA